PGLGDPAERRLDDDATGRAQEIVGRQHGGALRGRNQSVDEGLPDRDGGGEYGGPRGQDRQRNPYARRHSDERERRDTRHRAEEQEGRPASEGLPHARRQVATDDLPSGNDGGSQADDRV